MGKDCKQGRCYLPGSVLNYKVVWVSEVITLVHFYWHPSWLYGWCIGGHHAIGWATLATIVWPSQRNHLLQGSKAVLLTQLKLLLPYLFSPIFLLRAPFPWGIHSSSPLLFLHRERGTTLLVGHLVIIRTWVNSPEVEVSSEHIYT